MDGLQYSSCSCVSVASYRRGIVLCKELHGRDVDKGCLQVWDLKSDGTQERYDFVYVCKNILGFELARAALLHQDSSKRFSVERCSSHAVRFERSSAEGKLLEEPDSMLLLRVEDDFVAVLAESDYMMCFCVANCNDRVLVAAVSKAGKVTVLDAQTSDVISQFCTTKDDLVRSVALLRREDGRVLIVTGNYDGIIRMRMAGSGELMSQWQDSFVLVWDANMGTVLRTRNINGAGWTRPLGVAVSISGDWILCASEMEVDRAVVNLWGLSNQEFSACCMRFGKNKRSLLCHNEYILSRSAPCGNSFWI
jgi:hypothetical protein